MLIGITCRVDDSNEYRERRDCFDQRWLNLSSQFDNLVLIPIANSLHNFERLRHQLLFDGFILSGGNDLVPLGGGAPERDALETALLAFADETNKPVLGVCRGMQLMQHLDGVPLVKVANHAGTEVDINYGQYNTSHRVNSYHCWAAMEAGSSYQMIAKSCDGVVKAIKHRSRPWWGVMWHPERNQMLTTLDEEIIKGVFKL